MRCVAKMSPQPAHLSPAAIGLIVASAACFTAIDAIVKFGLGLLRVPDRTVLPIPILSFHHGDPGAYRGRPAGFWELIEGASFVGQVVQILRNRLDAGRVVAFAGTVNVI